MPGIMERKKIAPVLALVFVAMLTVMTIYEVTKQLLNPSITIWESHAITIVFTSVMAIFIIYFPLRSFLDEQQKTQDALRRQLEAEENLRKSKVQYRSFVESVEDSIYTVDRDCRYLLINARHLARRGLSPDVYMGRQYRDFHSPEESAAFSAQVKQVLSTRHPVQDEYEQDKRYYLRKLNPVIDPATNEVIAITVISSDITARKAEEKHLESVNRKLNLLNDITRHDMLNQLTVLSSLLTLAEEQSSDHSTQKYLTRCEQVVDTIHAQINFARDYQKIGVGSPAWQDIPAAIQKARAPLKLTSVYIDGSCSDREIFSDPLLEKVFYNLMENAVRYAGPQPHIRFYAREEAGRLIIVCEDNGPGVAVAVKEKIFERGYGKNTGLGLFLIREILTSTGIAINETGDPGTGSRFEIEVPAGAHRKRVNGKSLKNAG